MKRSDLDMHLTVIGAGHLGLTHAACMADLGHKVLAIDVDRNRIAKAAAGVAPFFEPGLELLLSKNLDAGRLHFGTSYEEAADFADVHFLCVGTVQTDNGAADLTSAYAAAETLAPFLTSRCLIVGKSTVPVGTARKLMALVKALAPAGELVELAWNPEFLREGSAVQDTLHPSRLVFGVTSDSAVQLLRHVYAKLLGAGIPELIMNLETAELTKLAANAFLATKISFINAIADVCEITGADIALLAKALAHDERIGRQHLTPGLGFGGGCLPKDLRALRAAAAALGVDSAAGLLGEVDAINLARRARIASVAREAVGGSLADKRVAVLGVAFKPGSDDVRDSPSLDVCDRLSREGAIVSVHDPAATTSAARLHPDLRYEESVLAAAEAADLVLHLTEWSAYQAIDPTALGMVVAHRIIIDARCALDAELWCAAGWTIRILGRSWNPRPP
jgi:UDPglucose 6-dehydrogenase